MTDPASHNARCELGAKHNAELSRLDSLDQKKMDDVIKTVLVAVTTYLLKTDH